MINCCPMCGCGKLGESAIYGFECDNCGEVFETGADGELQIVGYYKWREYQELHAKQENRKNSKKTKK